VADLSEEARRILAFEEQHRGHRGAKETAIREAFGWHPSRYYARLNSIIGEPEAVVEFPQLVYALRERRARVAEARARRELRPPFV
jgi:hypothetical protein